MGGGFGTKILTLKVHQNMFYFGCRSPFLHQILLWRFFPSYFPLEKIHLKMRKQVFLDCLETKRMIVPVEDLHYYCKFFFLSTLFVLFGFSNLREITAKIQLSH